IGARIPIYRLMETPHPARPDPGSISLTHDITATRIAAIRISSAGSLQSGFHPPSGVSH
ncbi:hypothetical protein KI387_041242, partial [Taxus chinensis]